MTVFRRTPFMKMTRKSIRRQNWKKKIALAAVTLTLLGSTSYARQVFVPGGWNTLYSERFTPTIGRSRGYDNARTNRRHYSWVRAHTGEYGRSSTVPAHHISYARVIAPWNARYNGWYINS